MIAEIRKYIEDQLKDCASHYVKIDLAFFNEADTIGNREYQYQIEIGAATPEIADTDTGFVDNIPVTLNTYANGNAREGLTTDIFDKAYSDALIIKALILDNSKIESQDYIKGVTSTTVIPSLVGDSQEVYRYTCTYNFKISYGIGE